jgi:hypothetical protein
MTVPSKTKACGVAPRFHRHGQVSRIAPAGLVERLSEPHRKEQQMRNRIAMGALLVAALAITVPAFAGNGNGNGNNSSSGGGGGGGGALTTTIALDGQSNLASTASGPVVSGPASFDVTRSYAYDKDTIYVVNTCWDASGAQVLRVGVQVLWGFSWSLSGTTGPMPTAGTHCSAYVSVANKQVGDALNYGVSS